MSMLSSKCDELRKKADRLRETATRVEIFLEGCTDAIPMDTHEQLRSAANIIWELRNKLAGMVDQQDEIERLEDENARLRSCLSDDAENARQIKAENAKLRAERDYLLANSNPTATELRRVRSAWKKDRDESAKLREQVVQLKNDWESERDYANQMEANEREAVSENAKLRELCADMWTCIREGEWDCSDCPRYARCNDGVSEFIDRMRELGVEVTE